MTILIANDHAGTELKKILMDSFKESVFADFGTSDLESVDYPDFAKKLCLNLNPNSEDLGVLICGSGQGMAIAANKFSHIRAALCWDVHVAKLAREHNNANVLCLGGRIIGKDLAINILKTFINTQFLHGRHETRVNKIGKLP
jgi:ribose 5-phosphate isomerase B